MHDYVIFLSISHKSNASWQHPKILQQNSYTNTDGSATPESTSERLGLLLHPRDPNPGVVRQVRTQKILSRCGPKQPVHDCEWGHHCPMPRRLEHGSTPVWKRFSSKSTRGPNQTWCAFWDLRNIFLFVWAAKLSHEMQSELIVYILLNPGKHWFCVL